MRRGVGHGAGQGLLIDGFRFGVSVIALRGSTPHPHGPKRLTDRYLGGYTLRRWAVWAAALAVVLLLNGIVWIMVGTS